MRSTAASDPSKPHAHTGLLKKYDRAPPTSIGMSKLDVADEELRKGQDPVLIFWKAFGIFKEGNVTEALRELTRVQERREITLAACIALIYYHERCRNVDQEAIDTLTLEMDDREEMASDRDLSTATTFLWHCQQFKRAG